MKIVVTSDWHLDHVSHGVDRHVELAIRAIETCTYAIEQCADAYLFLGDLCDPDRGADVVKSLSVSIEIAVRLKAAGIPSLWLAGNHDVIEDGFGRSVLHPLRHLATVVEEPGVHALCEGLHIACLPFTSAAKPYFPQQVVQTWKQQIRTGVPLAVGHLNVPGLIPGEEVKEMRRGRDVQLPVTELEGWAKLIMNGHIHRQYVAGAVRIPGSLAQLTFGEGANDPGFLVCEW
jgi:DNA repair exonuclease SbcCD nuclease subunit